MYVVCTILFCYLIVWTYWLYSCMQLTCNLPFNQVPIKTFFYIKAGFCYDLHYFENKSPPLSSRIGYTINIDDLNELIELLQLNCHNIFNSPSPVILFVIGVFCNNSQLHVSNRCSLFMKRSKLTVSSH